MTDSNIPQPTGPLRADSLTPQQASKIFSHVYSEQITEQQIREVAEAAEILRADDTFNLIHYCAYIVKEMGRGKS